MPKRKIRPESNGAGKRPPSNCIIHVKTSNLCDFVRLSDLEDPQKKFKKICKTRDKRLKEPLGSSRRMQVVCEQIPPEFDDDDVYHRGCYQRFTMNISRLKVTSKPRKNKNRGCQDDALLRVKKKLSFNQIAYFANVMVKLSLKNKICGHRKV